MVYDLADLLRKRRVAVKWPLRRVLDACGDRDYVRVDLDKRRLVGLHAGLCRLKECENALVCLADCVYWFCDDLYSLNVVHRALLVEVERGYQLL